MNRKDLRDQNSNLSGKHIPKAILMLNERKIKAYWLYKVIFIQIKLDLEASILYSIPIFLKSFWFSLVFLERKYRAIVVYL